MPANIGEDRLSSGPAERRLVAILAADVVGYSRMVGADEAGTLTRLRTLRREVIDPLFAEHGGRVFKTTGDGLLAEFPSTVQALRCAIEVQQRLRDAGGRSRHGAQFKFGADIDDKRMAPGLRG